MSEVETANITDGVDFAKAVARWLINHGDRDNGPRWTREQAQDGSWGAYEVPVGGARVRVTTTAKANCGIQIFDADDDVLGTYWDGDSAGLPRRLMEVAKTAHSRQSIDARRTLLNGLDALE